MPKMYKDDFTNERRLAFMRSRSQAAFRDEEWTITFSEFCRIWNTPQLWSQRGRGANSLVMTRLDTTAAWSTDNICLIDRAVSLVIKNKRQANLPYEDLYKDAIRYE